MHVLISRPALIYRKRLLRVCLSVVVLLPPGSALQAQDCSRCHQDLSREALLKAAGITEKAVGVMDKGQLSNNTSNVGDLANFHIWFTNAGHWPRSARDDHQYAFGLGFMVAVNDTNVIETVSQSMTRITDWLPPDDAAGRQYSGDIKASDDTPYQASSDLVETWPYGYYDDTGTWVDTRSEQEHHWPGHYRIDLNHPDFPNTLVEKEGEFVSGRDLYSLYNDDYNSRGRVGLEVEQTAYSFGRPYAEDFVFWELRVRNNSGRELDSLWVGMYAKFRPDYDNHDYINILDSDNNWRQDFVYVYDLNNTPNKTWAETDDPLGIVGLRIYDTPDNRGITDFHHFARGVSPSTDEELWALMTSDRDSPYLLDPKYYFHGSDRRIDYTGEDSLSVYYPSWYDEESGVDLEGDAINFIVASGPFTLQADSTVTFSLALIMGDAGTQPDAPDLTDLMENLAMANKMYEAYYQGPAPPSPPVVQAVPGDQRVTLYWSAEPSESSRDPLSGELDFEGYKIFRSTDKIPLSSWGTPIHNVYGELVGYVPLAIFDLVDDVEGKDPAFPQHLGTNSGLTHTFVDSNLINGVEYYYCVTAYDKGNQNPDELMPSLMYPLGRADSEPHVVAVVPGVTANNIAPPWVTPGKLTPQGGRCDGTVQVKIVDPAAITGHDYQITFSDFAVSAKGDTSGEPGFTLVDITEMDTLFHHHTLSDETGDNLPVVDGFRLVVQEPEPDVTFLGWTKVQGDTCTFDWRVESIDPNAGAMLIQKEVATYDDWRITVSYTGGDSVTWFDAFTGEIRTEKQYVPLRVEIITDPDNPVDVTDEIWLCEFAIDAPWEDYRRYYYSPLGWDLIPGGTGYLPGTPGWYEKHVDFFILQKIEIDPVSGDTIPNYLYLFTNNKPDTSYNLFGEQEIIDAVPPTEGDQFTILTRKNFSPQTTYEFTTRVAIVSDTVIAGNPLKNIRVVPDPYVVTNIWEQDEFGKRLQFNNLPQQCTIKIYTLVGEHVATVVHDSPTGYEFWDMRTRNDQFIAPGVYLYHAHTPDGYEALGRFLVIK